MLQSRDSGPSIEAKIIFWTFFLKFQVSLLFIYVHWPRQLLKYLQFYWEIMLAVEKIKIQYKRNRKRKSFGEHGNKNLKSITILKAYKA